MADSMGRITHGLKKVIVALIGLPLLVLGIVLIPLPGPGLLTCFLALFILSLGFDSADTYFQKIKKRLVALIQEAKK